MTTNVEKSVLVNRPVSIVYNQWTQFEDFPHFMSGVQKVEQLDDRNLHWVAEIGGVKRQRNATILEQVPDVKIAWAATDGATNAGAVYFEPAGTEQTTVRLHLEFEPEGLLDKAADALNIIEKKAEGDLQRFKDFIEDEAYSTGAWRGAVNPGIGVGTPGVEAAILSEGDKGSAGVSAKAAAVVAGAAAAGAAAVAAKGAVDKVKDAKAASDSAPPQPVSDAQHTHEGWIGRTVYDRNGDEFGSITDIFYDDATGQPEWMTVSTGWFGTKESFVPIAGTMLQGDDLRVDYDTELIKQAPTRGSDSHLDDEEEDRLYAHYGFDVGGTDYATRFGNRSRADEGYEFVERREVDIVAEPGAAGETRADDLAGAGSSGGGRRLRRYDASTTAASEPERRRITRTDSDR